jgi:hypothetical protein
MSIAGYNVDPESSDPVIGVEFLNGKAILYFDEGQGSTDFSLSYNEVGTLLGQLHEVHDQVIWAMATHVYAYGYNTAWHLTTKEEMAVTLCNRETGEVLWKRDPVVGEPGNECCKKCLRVYKKAPERQ